MEHLITVVFCSVFWSIVIGIFGCEQEMLGGNGAFCLVVGSFVVEHVGIF